MRTGVNRTNFACRGSVQSRTKMKTSSKQLLITKASGARAPFSPETLRHSLVRSGASPETAGEIAEQVKQQLFEGISTRAIYRLAFRLLKSRSGKLASKYHLKRGIMELGPSGFPFELYVSGILSAQGYRTLTSQTVKGRCVSHEVDIIAEKDDRHFMIECKYHNLPGTVSDVRIPLYIKARFDDVKDTWVNQPGHQDKFHQGWVVTNTRFTTDAIAYGECAGLNLISWDHPRGKSLRETIDRMGLYPLTCLTRLNKAEKERLLAKKVVLCRDIAGNEELLRVAGVRPGVIPAVIEECRQLCSEVNSRQLSI
jgi:hypothetical protein